MILGYQNIKQEISWYYSISFITKSRAVNFPTFFSQEELNILLV